jgi:hypothetical protein
MRSRTVRRPRRSVKLFIIGWASVAIALVTVIGPPAVALLALLTGRLFAFDDVLFRRQLGANCVLNTEHPQLVLQTKDGLVLVPTATRNFDDGQPAHSMGQLTELVVSGDVIAGRETDIWGATDSYFLMSASQGTVVSNLTKDTLAQGWRARTGTALPELQGLSAYRPYGERVLGWMILIDGVVFLITLVTGPLCLALGLHYRKLERQGASRGRHPDITGSHFTR